MHTPQIDSPIHVAPGLAWEKHVAGAEDIARAERHLMQTALDACEVGNPDTKLIHAPRCGAVYARDLVTMDMDEGQVFRLICAAAKSQDIAVRLAAQALIAAAAADFARGWAE